MLENFVVELLGEHIAAGLGLILVGISLLTIVPASMRKLLKFMDERSDRRSDLLNKREKEGGSK